MIRALALALALLPGLLQGAWEFTAPIPVSDVHGPGVFHHLESAGRRSIAVSGGRVAITWEDEHEGGPRVYVASKLIEEQTFTAAPAISGNGESFEPTIVALADGDFAIAWEEDEAVWVRLLRFAAAGPALGDPLRLSKASAGQVSLAQSRDAVFAVWAEANGRHRHVRFTRLTVSGALTLQAAAPCEVEPQPPAADQLYPTVAALPDMTVVAWEDRRRGHTIIMAARATAASPCAFSAAQRISEEPPGPDAPYGKGHGVARVALANFGDARLMAAWADKRDFRHGYDIWGAALQADGAFGPNQRIQDDFGELSQQWHTALAGHPSGLRVTAWDDNREGHADIAISWFEQGAWSDDLMVPGASGPGEQQHPTLTFDHDGRLHLAWVHRDRPGGPTRLFYSMGSYQPAD
jgi:hypothetical protein